MPKFVVDAVKEKITGKVVGVLGYTFKRDTDDTRDTLSYKMINYIKRNVPSEVLISDRWLGQSGVTVTDPFNEFEFVNHTEDEILKTSSIIFIGTNHSHYYTEEMREKLHDFVSNGGIVVDVWNLLGDGKLVYGE
jgi:UDP-N-acetyl-D-mannosaminuronic acid dehydrogenase